MWQGPLGPLVLVAAAGRCKTLRGGLVPRVLLRVAAAGRGESLLRVAAAGGWCPGCCWGLGGLGYEPREDRPEVAPEGVKLASKIT